MQTMQHLCGHVVDARVWITHGETILDVSDPESGLPITICPECGEEFFENTLFPLDIFPELAALMASVEV